MQLKVFYRSFPETSRCPACGKIGTIRRSRARNILESVLKSTSILGIYKCKECGWRGYQKKYYLNRYSLITLLFYSGLIFTVAYVIRKVLAKNFGDGE